MDSFLQQAERFFRTFGHPVVGVALWFVATCLFFRSIFHINEVPYLLLMPNFGMCAHMAWQHMWRMPWDGEKPEWAQRVFPPYQ